MKEDKFGPRCRVHYAETPEEGIREIEITGMCGKAEHGVIRGLCRNRSDLMPRRSRPGGERTVRPRKTVIVSLFRMARGCSWPLEGFPASSGIHTAARSPNQGCAAFQIQARLAPGLLA